MTDRQAVPTLDGNVSAQQGHLYCTLHTRTESAKMSARALSDQLMPDAYQGLSPNSRLLAGAVPTSEISWKSYLLRSSWSVIVHVAGFALLI